MIKKKLIYIMIYNERKLNGLILILFVQKILIKNEIFYKKIYNFWKLKLKRCIEKMKLKIEFFKINIKCLMIFKMEILCKILLVIMILGRTKCKKLNEWV